MAVLPERTIPYKTYIKRSLVEALREVFANHPDTMLRRTKVSIDYPTSELSYPSVVIRFFERSVRNAGVGHVEYLYNRTGSYILVVKNGDLVFKVEAVDDNEVGTKPAEYRAQGYTVKIFDQYESITKFRHYLYDGDIEFAVFALSSLDRDLISDTLVQTLAMPDMAAYTNNFFNRIYFPTDLTPSNSGDYEPGHYNYVNLNTDRVTGFGETQTPQPWLSEDQLVYQTSYRIGIYGEFYSLPPITDPAVYGLISKINVLPYSEFVGDAIPTGVPPHGSVTFDAPSGNTTVPADPGTESDPAEWPPSEVGDLRVQSYDPTQWH